MRLKDVILFIASAIGVLLGSAISLLMANVNATFTGIIILSFLSLILGVGLFIFVGSLIVVYQKLPNDFAIQLPVAFILPMVIVLLVNTIF
ncbi:hypothetical protein BRE01_62950 [Brevibacillus reuszeri]|uniref:Uncharacterized protein n=1 Tax=Brevibacillus reuszeri TaxID=54915 RepID=A0A0K9YW65_9BACL|nr:hypothetical protein [Brevibacillus reuszeri]KNB72974.1 hypothetical protein ADS79_14230 [Brevibacillus reuszeri]GED72593.1 hypothetical protein BRE01_62950 [Brevibacillus reuszeri]